VNSGPKEVAMKLDARTYAIGGGAVAAVAAGVELVRVVLAPQRVPGLNATATTVLGLLLVVTLAAAAIGLAGHRRFGPIVAVFGGILALGFGAAASSARAHTWGTIYMVVGLFLLYALGKSIPYFRAAEA
jgi:hypothetical protein